MKKLAEFIKRCPLASVLILSAAILTLAGIVGMISGKYRANLSLKHPFVASVLNRELTSEPAPDEAVGLSEEVPEVASSDSDDLSEDAIEVPQAEPQEPQYEEREAAEPRSIYYDDPGKTAMTTQYDYIKVDDAWFSDALIIGDSRVEGWSLYGGLDTATYVYEQGLTTNNLFTDTLTTSTGESMTLSDLLAANKYSKIYLMLGVNDLGIGTIDDFSKTYETAIRRIQLLQPDATLFMLSIVNVTTSYSDGDDVINNDNVNARNCRIASFSDGVSTFYLDLNTTCCDDTGGLNADYTTDGVHLRAEYYPLWSDYLREHGIE